MECSHQFPILLQHLMGSTNLYSSSLRDSVLIHPHTTELIIDQLDLQNSACYEWGVICFGTSTPLTTIQFGVTDRNPCSINGERQKLHKYFHVDIAKPLDLVRILDLALVRYHSRHFKTEKCISYGKYTHIHSPS